MNDWIEVLRAACETQSQREVAQRIGFSQTVVSQVLNGSYARSTERLRAAVERMLMRDVTCPVLGLISRQRCMEHQRRPFTATNPTNVKLYRACRSGCAHSFMPPTLDSQASADQPAVSHNTGSRGEVSPCFRHVTQPTRRRKRPTKSLGNDKS